MCSASFIVSWRPDHSIQLGQPASQKSRSVSDLYQLSSDSDEPPRRRKKAHRKSEASEASRQESFVDFLRSFQHTIAELAAESSKGWLLFVLVLSTSLAFDAIFRAGFVPMLFNGLTYLNFVVHELGHLVCSMVPMWIHVAAGTFVQVALPTGAIVMFARQRDGAAACFAVCWLAISLMHTADYMADARMMQSDMTMSAGFWSLTSGQQVRPDEVVHDWNYLLQSVGLLSWDRFLAGCVRLFAGLVAAVAVATNAYMVWERFSLQRKRSSR